MNINKEEKTNSSNNNFYYLDHSFETYEQIIDFIRNKLPIISHPEALGLDLNAKIARDSNEAKYIFDNFLLTLPKDV
jgi:hypothetical protein